LLLASSICTHLYFGLYRKLIMFNSSIIQKGRLYRINSDRRNWMRICNNNEIILKYLKLLRTLPLWSLKFILVICENSVPPTYCNIATYGWLPYCKEQDGKTLHWKDISVFWTSHWNRSIPSLDKLQIYLLLKQTVPLLITLPQRVNTSWRKQLSPLGLLLLSYSKKNKGKAVPLQARSGPEGSRKLRFPDFVTTAQNSGQPYSPAAFTPWKCFRYSFLLEAESTPGPHCDRKNFMSMKNSNDTS